MHSHDPIVVARLLALNNIQKRPIWQHPSLKWVTESLNGNCCSSTDAGYHLGEKRHRITTILVDTLRILVPAFYSFLSTEASSCLPLTFWLRFCSTYPFSIWLSGNS